jgi:hypothetical protein
MVFESTLPEKIDFIISFFAVDETNGLAIAFCKSLDSDKAVEIQFKSLITLLLLAISRKASAYGLAILTFLELIVALLN